MPLFLSYFLTVHVDADVRRRAVCWEPVFGVLVEEGPWRNNDEEGENGAGETNVECEADVLCRVADKESDDLME